MQPSTLAASSVGRPSALTLAPAHPPTMNRSSGDHGGEAAAPVAFMARVAACLSVPPPPVSRTAYQRNAPPPRVQAPDVRADPARSPKSP